MEISNEDERDENELKNKEYTLIEKYDLQNPFSSVSIFQKISESMGSNSPKYDFVGSVTEYFYEIREPDFGPEKKKLFEKVLGFLNDSSDFELFERNFKNDGTGFENNKNNENCDLFLENEIRKLLKLYSIRLSEDDFKIFIYFVKRDFFGFGRIQPLLEDSEIEDISCSGGRIPIYIFHRRYGPVKTNLVLSEIESDKLIRRMAQCSKKHISVSNPMTDATLPNGSRAHLTLGSEITTKGSTFTIRKFNEKPFLPEDLVNNGTFSTDMMSYLWLCIESNMNLMFAGGTASGKTTSLNAVCRFIPPNKKIVSIEDTREINLPHENWISGVSRESSVISSAVDNFENFAGRVSLYDLLKAALRQRPEYILVGEIRGSEAYVLFQAMSTGHTTVSTMHAESADTLIHRLENPPMNVPRIMIQTLDVLVLLAQIENEEGHLVKKCMSIHEILETDPQTSEVLTQEIFNHLETRSKGQETVQISLAADTISKSAALEKIRIRKDWTKERLTAEFDKRVFYFSSSDDTTKNAAEKE